MGKMESSMNEGILPQLLEQLQSSSGLSWRELARRCGLPESQLRDVKDGKSKRPSPRILRGIEKGFGVNYDRLALAAYGRLTDPPKTYDPDGYEPDDEPGEDTQPTPEPVGASAP